MNLQIISIHNHGKAAEEYVVLKATADCKLGDYLLADSTYISEKLISNRLRHMYWWLTSASAKKGDFVYLYTRIGKDEVRTSGGNTHRDFYWNLKEPVWNDTGDVAVLMNIAEWKFTLTGKK